MLRTVCLVSLCLLGGHAFAPRAPRAASVRMAVEQTVPNQQFAAGASGFALGLLTGGPVLGSVLGFACNQGTKVEGEVGEYMLKLGEAAIEGWTSASAKAEAELLPKLEGLRWEQDRTVYGYPQVVEHLDWVKAYIDEKQLDAKFINALEKVESYGLPARR